MDKNKIPQEVVRAIGKALAQEELKEFWNNPHESLGGKSPRQLWERGEKNKVLQFIESAKSGDMA